MKYFFTLQSDLPADVGFPLWGRQHLCWLVICAGLAGILCTLSMRLREPGQKRLRRGIGWAVLLCELLKDGNLIIQGAFGLYYLPLHLCGLAVFFTFFHSRHPTETIGNFLYSTCMPGAACALLFPDWTMFPAFSYHSLVAFVVHGLLAAYPLTLLAAGRLHPRPELLPRCFGILLGLAVPIYLFDRAFQVNYMYLLRPAPDSPLEWFAALLGNPGYLFGYLPMLALVWGLLYLPFFPKVRRGAKR